MTRIDFYILPDASALLPAAVKLCDRAVQSQAKVFVCCPETAALNAMDDLLWTHRQGSFLAHERFEGRAPDEPLPHVLLGTGEPPDGWQDVLINLGHDVLPFFSRFERLCEIVGQEEKSKQASRARFKFYRDRGYALKTLQMTADGSWVES